MLQAELVIDKPPFRTTLSLVVLENYDVMNSGFLQIIVNLEHLSVDYFSRLIAAIAAAFWGFVIVGIAMWLPSRTPRPP
jgi:hypothetical protein